MSGISSLFMNNILQAFEHSYIVITESPIDIDGKRIGITEKEYNSLVKFHSKNSNYYSIFHRKIKLKHYVGVLQIENLIIEILPKADSINSDYRFWQEALYEMIRIAKNTRGNLTPDTNLKIQNKSLLDIYLYHFLDEVEMILHRGMTKKYIFKDANLNSFRGKLNTTIDAIQNFANRSKAHCHYQDYTYDHLFNQILKEALNIVSSKSLNLEIKGMANKHLLSFESISTVATNMDLKLISVDRKHEYYSEAIKIAKLILANSSPNIKSGHDDSIAFLFDMNHLFEEFVFKTLKHGLAEYGFDVKKTVKEFWNGKLLKPDIMIEGNGKKIVIDTKWKNSGGLPSDPDIKQMFAYNEQFNFDSGYLMYPGKNIEGIDLEKFKGKEHGLGTILVNVVDYDGHFNPKLIIDEVLRRLAD
jgi:5-methylcytosine-specific restriction enzyme subunit McrC